MHSRTPTSKRALSQEKALFLLALLSGLPSLAVSLVILWTGDYSQKVALTWTLFLGATWLGFACRVRSKSTYITRTLANVLTAMREGDYSMRARPEGGTGAMSELIFEINQLSATLQRQRLSEIEITALLTTVMREIDVAIFAFDGDKRLRLANQSGQFLLDRSNEELVGKSAEALGLEECLEGAPTRLLTRSFPGGSGRWEMRRSRFHERGKPHELVVIADLTRTLREEELQAWQRLVRVLSHELNNSLAPIKSIAGTLRSLAQSERRPGDWEDDLRKGLGIIESRSENLSRFLEAYARLARLPRPTRRPCDIAVIATHVAALESRVPVTIPKHLHSLTFSADDSQLEQALINLVRNAADAVLEQREATGRMGSVTIEWESLPPEMIIRVIDEGTGLPSSANLFVPFFTTKPEGSGIGLVLARQIAENHGGTLRLESKQDGFGTVAVLHIPL